MSQSSLDLDHQMLRVGMQSFPLEALTAAKRTMGVRKGEPYSVRDVFTALLHADASIRDYVSYCQKHQVSRLMESERKELIKFMLGELSLSESLLLVDHALLTGSGLENETYSTASSHRVVAKDIGELKHGEGDDDASATVDDVKRLDAWMQRERVQRSVDSFLEVDKRKRVDFTKLSAMGVLQSLVSRKRMRSGDVGKKDHAGSLTEVDIARGDRYKTDTRRAYREAGLGEVERLEIDPAAGFSEAAAATSASTGHVVTASTGLPATPVGEARSKKPEPIPTGLVHYGQSIHLPIIILPAGQQPLMTMFNAASFLERGEFISMEEIRKRGNSKPPSGRQIITHEKQSFMVTDQPSRLNPSEWNQVVAVVCQGAAWQFKGWPFPGGPAQLFAQKKGFYFLYDDEKVPTHVSQWAVKCIRLSRSRRHMDESAALDFWTLVTSHLRRMQSNLLRESGFSG